MAPKPDFDLRDFLPYLLNQAAERTSLAFQGYYKERYGMLRTEWRVLFHLGRYGEITAKEICTRAQIHKTKVSRAVAALEDKRMLKRKTLADDRRHEVLSLTKKGRAAYDDLSVAAQAYDAELSEKFTSEQVATLRACLTAFAQLPIDVGPRAVSGRAMHSRGSNHRTGQA